MSMRKLGPLVSNKMQTIFPQNHLRDTRIILASGSPRRKEILEKIGLDFEVSISSFAEDLPKKIGQGAQYAEATATAKALDVSQAVKDLDDNNKVLIIAADTVVELEDTILEKPRDADHAKFMLSMLSGRSHEVHTGVALVFMGTEGKQCLHSFYETTKVEFMNLTEEDIDFYIASGETFGKAGGYAIQGRAAPFVKSIVGCYANVVGLPIHRLCREISSLKF